MFNVLNNNNNNQSKNGQYSNRYNLKIHFVRSHHGDCFGYYTKMINLIQLDGLEFSSENIQDLGGVPGVGSFFRCCCYVDSNKWPSGEKIYESIFHILLKNRMFPTRGGYTSLEVTLDNTYQPIIQQPQSNNISFQQPYLNNEETSTDFLPYSSNNESTYDQNIIQMFLKGNNQSQQQLYSNNNNRFLSSSDQQSQQREESNTHFSEVSQDLIQNKPLFAENQNTELFQNNISHIQEFKNSFDPNTILRNQNNNIFNDSVSSKLDFILESQSQNQSIQSSLPNNNKLFQNNNGQKEQIISSISIQSQIYGNQKDLLNNDDSINNHNQSSQKQDQSNQNSLIQNYQIPSEVENANDDSQQNQNQQDESNDNNDSENEDQDDYESEDEDDDDDDDDDEDEDDDDDEDFNSDEEQQNEDENNDEENNEQKEEEEEEDIRNNENNQSHDNENGDEDEDDNNENEKEIQKSIENNQEDSQYSIKSQLQDQINHKDMRVVDMSKEKQQVYDDQTNIQLEERIKEIKYLKQQNMKLQKERNSDKENIQKLESTILDYIEENSNLKNELRVKSQEQTNNNSIEQNQIFHPKQNELASLIDQLQNLNEEKRLLGSQRKEATDNQKDLIISQQQILIDEKTKENEFLKRQLDEKNQILDILKNIQSIIQK